MKTPSKTEAVRFIEELGYKKICERPELYAKEGNIIQIDIFHGGCLFYGWVGFSVSPDETAKRIKSHFTRFDYSNGSFGNVFFKSQNEVLFSTKRFFNPKQLDEALNKKSSGLLDEFFISDSKTKFSSKVDKIPCEKMKEFIEKRGREFNHEKNSSFFFEDIPFLGED